MGVFKKNNPGNCVDPGCGCGAAPCSSAAPVAVTATAACCAAYPLDIELFDGATSLGVFTVASSPGAGSSFTLPTTVLPGTLITWTATKSPYPNQSGSFTLSCAANSITINWVDFDAYLTDTITLTDPLGNAIGLTRRSLTPGTANYRKWDGERTYTIASTGHPDLVLRITYTWNDAGPCKLKLAVPDFDATTYTMDAGSAANYCADSVASATPWGTPSGSADCYPLLMQYIPWWNLTGNHPDPPFPARSNVCACGSPFWNGFTANFVAQGYKPFLCEGVFTVTL